jgi:hypothetical protein
VHVAIVRPQLAATDGDDGLAGPVTDVENVIGIRHPREQKFGVVSEKCLAVT